MGLSAPWLQATFPDRREEASRTLAPGDFSQVTRIIAEARQTVVFGLGVLGYMAGYFARPSCWRPRQLTGIRQPRR